MLQQTLARREITEDFACPGAEGFDRGRIPGKLAGATDNGGKVLLQKPSTLCDCGLLLLVGLPAALYLIHGGAKHAERLEIFQTFPH